jgi:hypothetical protein
MAKLYWSDEARRYQFYQGLNDKIKDRLIDLEPAKTYLQMVEDASRIGERLWQREQEKRGFTNFRPQGRKEDFQAKFRRNQQQHHRRQDINKEIAGIKRKTGKIVIRIKVRSQISGKKKSCRHRNRK